MDIYVGNLPKGTRPAEIKKLIKESFRGHIFQGLYNRILNLGRFDRDMAVNIHKKPGRRGYRYGKIHFNSVEPRLKPDSIDPRRQAPRGFFLP